MTSSTGIETWTVWLEQLPKEEWEDEDSPVYHVSMPLELPPMQGWHTALGAAIESDWISWTGEGMPPELEEGGAYVNATFDWESYHYSGPDGDDYDFILNLTRFQSVTDEWVREAKKKAKNFRQRELYWIRKAGCDQYEMTSSGQTRCSKGLKNVIPIGSSPQGLVDVIVPNCARNPGQICLLHSEWKPREKLEYTLPKNHFLDGTGVCRYAGSPYDTMFDGHTWSPSVQELADRRDVSVESITAAFDEQATDAILAGKFSFWFKYPEKGSWPVAVKASNRGANCGRCSGLPLYEGDCDYYTERKLKPTEFIVPCTKGSGSHNNREVRWRFIVLDLIDGPIHHPWFYSGDSAKNPHWNGVDKWGQWWRMSNSYDSTTMWTSYGIPVSGSPGNKPMWGTIYDFHKIRDRLNHYQAIYENLRSIAEVAGDVKGEGRWGQNVGRKCRETWRSIAEDALPLIYGLTVHGDVGVHMFQLRDALPKKLIRWSHSNLFTHSYFPWDGWSYEDHLSILARLFMLRRLVVLSTHQPGFAVRFDEQVLRKERSLFAHKVDDPWLRIAYGLEGQPEGYWEGKPTYNDWKPEYDEPAVPEGTAGDPKEFVNLHKTAGRCMTEDAFTRMRVAWKVRYE